MDPEHSAEDPLPESVKKPLLTEKSVTSSRHWLEVRDVMSRQVATVSPDHTVVEAAKMMKTRNISCAVVLDNKDRVVGILTERDLLQRVAAKEGDFGEKKVSEAMTFPVQSISPAISIFEASTILESKKIRRLPVVENGELVGIVTQTDLTRVLASYGMWRTVGDVMSPNVSTIQQTESVWIASVEMSKRNVSCVVVMDGEKVSGILTERDVMKKIVALQRDPREIRITEVMSSPVLCIAADHSVFSAIKLIEEKKIRRLVVMEGAKLRGVLTQTDIFRTVKQKLQEEEESYVNMLEQSENAIYTADLNGLTTYVNPAFLRILQIENRSDLIGQEFLPERFWMDPKDRIRLMGQLRRGVSIEIKDLILKSAKDRKIFATLFWTFTKNVHGEVNGNQGLLYDITQKKELVSLREAEDHLRKSNEALHRLNEMKSDFVSMVTHDLGTYPHANGQVYGMGGKDGDRMPVEESGNMLIMLAALARQEGNANFVTNYWPMLTTWADYLVKEGLDPQNQLCSADMFGHLPRAANLALKAIIGIGGYAQLCEMTGHARDAKKHLAIARDYAARWQDLAKDDGRTRLAYHLPGTWGMKHNLIWDRVLGLNLFPDSIGDAEIAWYLKVQKKYGLPVDNRTDTSLIDWALWSIAPARSEADFQALLDPIWRYANETPSRVPLSDWFVTTDAKQKGFQARPVVGGIFIKMLADGPTWAKWAKQGVNASGPWAPIPIGGVAKEVVPTAQAAPVSWHYTLAQPAGDWFKPGFNDSTWKEGPAGFGTRGTPGAVIRTEWNTKQIWLRREFTLPDRALKNPRLLLIYDEDPEIYLNGVLAAKLTGWTTSYDEADIAPAALAALKPGKNVLAVRASQTYGGQAIDVGMVEDGEAKATTQLVKPVAGKRNTSALPGLRKLMDTPLRDTSICRGPDGTWYMTGTVEPFYAYNKGIKVWKSKDWTTWEPLGFVWEYGKSPWHEKYFKIKQPLWAPEIHFLKGTFWLTYSLPGWDGTGKTSGCGLLKSTTGKAEGPYEDVQPGERFGDEIDASLFQDDNGAVYFLWHSGKIARMKPDMSGLAEPYHWLRIATMDPNPQHHSGLCAGIFGANSFDHLGYEGMFLFKRQGTYYFCCSEQCEGRYSCFIATSTNIYGPYGERYEAIPHGGHNMFFQDDKEQWWSSYFGSDGTGPWAERAGVLPVEFTPEGRVRPKGAGNP